MTPELIRRSQATKIRTVVFHFPEFLCGLHHVLQKPRGIFEGRNIRNSSSFCRIEHSAAAAEEDIHQITNHPGRAYAKQYRDIKLYDRHQMAARYQKYAAMHINFRNQISLQDRKETASRATGGDFRHEHRLWKEGAREGGRPRPEAHVWMGLKDLEAQNPHRERRFEKWSVQISKNVAAYWIILQQWRRKVEGSRGSDVTSIKEISRDFVFENWSNFSLPSWRTMQSKSFRSHRWGFYRLTKIQKFFEFPIQ